MKRRGFTLIELMVVIAIIIILAAIAIPNYLKMTERAKRSRLSSDYATLATVLETFKTDWGVYPVGTAVVVSTPGTAIYAELAGTASGATKNVAANTNAVGETGPIEYIKPGTLTSMVNPFDTAKSILYTSAAGATWVVYTDIGTNLYYFRTDGKSTVSTLGTVPTPSS